MCIRDSNCSAPEGERPCNQCPTCQAITEGRMIDLIEIDAASNTVSYTHLDVYKRQLLAEENAIYLTPLYFSEVGVARRLQRLLRTGEDRLAPFARYHALAWEHALAAAEQGAGFPLAAQLSLIHI